MSEQPPDDPLPGTTPAPEPQSLIDHPLRASDVPALIAKEIGLPVRWPHGTYVTEGKYIGDTAPSRRVEPSPSSDHGVSPRMPDTTEYEYTVTFRSAGRAAKTVRAAGIGSDSHHPDMDMIGFFDGNGDPLLMVSRNEVLSVERAAIPEHAPAGFKPTSQIMYGT